MTRRGSVSYYLAGWVVGCLFMSLAVWLPGRWEPTHWTPEFKGASGFLAFYFLGLVFGAFTALLGAFLLRRLAALLSWKESWQWALLGAGLAGLLVLWLGVLDREMAERLPPRPIEFARILLLGGPGAIHPRAVWISFPVGAATAWALHLIQRAFEPRGESTDPPVAESQ